MPVVRNGWGYVSHVPTVRQTLQAKFHQATEFSVMQVMAAINSEIADVDERMTIAQVSNTMCDLYARDGNLRRVAAGRYCWAQQEQAK